MGVIEAAYNLGVNNDLAIHYEVRDQFANEMSAVMNWIIALLFNGMTARRQFNHQCVFVQLLVQTRPEFIQDDHRRANNLSGDFLVFHGKGVNHG
jgi:hypothetical protein